MLIAEVDVQDENEATHNFGRHEVEIVSGDDRFETTYNKKGDDEGTWQVRLKEGETLDFEKDDKDLDRDVDADNDGDADNDKQFELVLMATDRDGLSTPSGPGIDPIRLVITVTNEPEPSTPLTPNDVPGLKDDSSDNDGDDREDTTGDTDADGGSPPPGMSIGLIEDFVGDMDGVEQDLLEDFMLVIDDGIEIA